MANEQNNAEIGIDLFCDVCSMTFGTKRDTAKDKSMKLNTHTHTHN